MLPEFEEHQVSAAAGIYRGFDGYRKGETTFRVYGFRFEIIGMSKPLENTESDDDIY